MMPGGTNFPDFGAFEHVDVPVFAVELCPGRRFVYRWFNRAYETGTGIGRTERVDLPLEQVFPGPAGADRREAFGRALATGKMQRFDSLQAGPDGNRWWRVSASPLAGRRGPPRWLICTLADITGGQRASAAMIADQARSAELVDQMEQFVAMAAHDLNSPVNNVRTIAALLRDGFQDLGDGKIELLEMLEDIAVTSQKLISRILDYAQTSSIEPGERTVRLAGLANDIRAMLDPGLEHRLAVRNIVLATDDVALQIILQNLMDNAIKHSGRPSVQMMLRARPAAGGMVEFAFSDDGPGIAEPDLVFAGPKRAGATSGFGLAGIRRLILSRGGEIGLLPAWFRSGATFRFTFPGRILEAGEARAAA